MDSKKKKVLLTGAIRVSNVIETTLDPSDSDGRKGLEEVFIKHLQNIADSFTTEGMLLKVNAYDVRAEEIPNS